MADFKIAIRYARSLMGLAEERNQLQAVHADMAQLAAAIIANKELAVLLKSPVVKPDVKERILGQIFGASFNKVTMSFLQLVVRKRREDVIPTMAISFTRLYNIKMGIVEASLTTASDVDDAIRAEILRLVGEETQKTVQLETKTDPELIAGFVLKVGDNRFEASIARELKELRKLFSDNPYIQKY